MFLNKQNIFEVLTPSIITPISLSTVVLSIIYRDGHGT